MCQFDGKRFPPRAEDNGRFSLILYENTVKAGKQEPIVLK